jgi:ADP-ribosylglycohydrolase
VDCDRERKKFLGCVIGDAVGDATGAAFEFLNDEQIARHPRATHWVDDMLPALGRDPSPLGLWRHDPPLGTGTDDTRMSEIFARAVARHGVHVNSRLLAAEYVDRYLNRDEYYPGYHELAIGQLTYLFVAACGHLDMACPVHPDLPPVALRSGAGGFNLPGFRLPLSFGDLLHPTLIPMLMLPTAGLLHPGDPEAAYVHAFELAYTGVGYARDATALLAAMVAAGLDGTLSPRAAIRRALAVDPFKLGADRTMVQYLDRFLRSAEEAGSDRELVNALARALRARSPFDPVDILGVAVAACYRAEGDPRRAILMAVNHRDLDDDGSFRNFRDIDCTGSICGALVGALAPEGIDAFPPEWVSAVVSANKDVYGIDLTDSAERMYAAIRAAEWA